MTDWGRIRERQHYIEIIQELRQKLYVYEPVVIKRNNYYTYTHYFVILKKDSVYKTKFLKCTPLHKVGHIDSYGWRIVCIIHQVSFFDFEDV